MPNTDADINAECDGHNPLGQASSTSRKHVRGVSHRRLPRSRSVSPANSHSSERNVFVEPAGRGGRGVRGTRGYFNRKRGGNRQRGRKNQFQSSNTENLVESGTTSDEDNNHTLFQEVDEKPNYSEHSLACSHEFSERSEGFDVTDSVELQRKRNMRGRGRVFENKGIGPESRFSHSDRNKHDEADVSIEGSNDEISAGRGRGAWRGNNQRGRGENYRGSPSRGARGYRSSRGHRGRGYQSSRVVVENLRIDSSDLVKQVPLDSHSRTGSFDSSSSSEEDLDEGSFKQTRKIELVRLRYISARHMMTRFERSMKVSAFIDLRNSTLSVEGKKSKVFSVFTQVDNLISTFYEDSILLSHTFRLCFRSITPGEVIAIFKENRIVAGWDLRDDELHVCSDCLQNTNHAIEILKDLVVESEYPVTEQLSLTKINYIAIGNKWENLVTRLKKEDSRRFMQICYDDTLKKVKFAMKAGGNCYTVTQALDDFFQQADNVEETLHFPPQVAKLLSRNKDYVMHYCSENDATFELNDLLISNACTIKCQSQEMLQSALDRFNKLVDERVSKSVSHSKAGHIAWLKSEVGKDKLADIDTLSHTVSSPGVTRQTRTYSRISSRSPLRGQGLRSPSNVFRRALTPPPKMKHSEEPQQAPPRPSSPNPKPRSLPKSNPPPKGIIGQILDSLFSGKPKNSAGATPTPPVSQSTPAASKNPTNVAVTPERLRVTPELLQVLEIVKGDITTVNVSYAEHFLITISIP